MFFHIKLKSLFISLPTIWHTVSYRQDYKMQHKETDVFLENAGKHPLHYNTKDHNTNTWRHFTAADIIIFLAATQMFFFKQLGI